MRRLRFHVAYDGTDFHGWQVQPGLPTIQHSLQEVISTLEGKPVIVNGSGRTDAGVHALAQVAAVSLTNPIPADNFRRAVNRLLPSSIRISDVREMPISFHPRFDARSKLYEYRIYRNEVCPPFLKRYVHHHPFRLDEDRMRAAAELLIGEHDFTAFAATDPTDTSCKSKVRRIFGSTLQRDGDLLVYRVTGSGFLKHMVRNIIGVLVEAGKGNLTLADVEARLQPDCGIPSGPSLPACGLFLISVDYDEDRALSR